MFTAGQEIEIKHVTYIIQSVMMLDEVEQVYPNTARAMKKAGQVAKLVLKKPNGKNLYSANAFNDTRFTPTTVI